MKQAFHMDERHYDDAKRIGDIGGEFALIRRLTDRQRAADPDIVVGVGDDCAVVDKDERTYLLVTADMMVEDEHFTRSWYGPDQIGNKLVESNVSDIVSMGGAPRYGIISLSIPPSTELAFIDGIYDGIYTSSGRHGLTIIGGDTTRGDKVVISLTIIGEVERTLLRTRSLAREGDLICVTGTLGKSMAGLRSLQEGLSGDVRGYLEPMARSAEEARAIALHAHAMIDVSDGLGSEVAHICERSGVGAVIYKGRIPLDPAAVDAAEKLHESAYDYALYGGEDFELVFTLPPERVDALQGQFDDFVIVGKVVSCDEGMTIVSDGKRERLRSGYDHFRESNAQNKPKNR
jgi:thiamine-monophosphate kinase